MNVKKIVLITAVAFVLFYMVTAPTQAADAAQGAFRWLGDSAEAVIVFVRGVFA